jgi:hypothetical protein
MSTTLKTAASSSITGGSDVVFVAQEIRNGTIITVQSSAELSVRQRLTSKVSPSVNNAKAPGGKQNARHEITLGQPFTCANGDVGANSIQIALSRHPEATQSQVDTLIGDLISGLVDSGVLRVALKSQIQLT